MDELDIETKTWIAPLEYAFDHKNLRVVLAVEPSLLGADVEVDVASLRKAVDGWLSGDGPLVLFGMTMKLYELKEETWRERPPML